MDRDDDREVRLAKIGLRFGTASCLLGVLMLVAHFNRWRVPIVDALYETQYRYRQRATIVTPRTVETRRLGETVSVSMVIFGAATVLVCLHTLRNRL